MFPLFSQFCPRNGQLALTSQVASDFLGFAVFCLVGFYDVLEENPGEKLRGRTAVTSREEEGERRDTQGGETSLTRLVLTGFFSVS